MRITRLYTGGDGRSHFEDLDVPVTETGRGLDSALLPGTGAIVRDRSTATAMDMDFHNAPRRQLVIPVGGGLEVEVGDGTVRRFDAGSVLLADDLEGQGHKTRSIGDLTHMIFVVLPDEFDPATWRA